MQIIYSTGAIGYFKELQLMNEERTVLQPMNRICWSLHGVTCGS